MNNPILNQLNNGISTSSGMPMKDLSSDNDASFGMSRKIFARAFVPKTNFLIPQIGTTVIERQALGIGNKVVIDGKKTVGQKKWIGGNRDASSMITRRQIINTSQINAHVGPQSFKNIEDNNTAKDARIRVRSSGYRVPPKVTQKNVLPIIPIYYPPTPGPDPDPGPGPVADAYFRVNAVGWAAIGSQTTRGVYGGAYIYDPPVDMSGTAITNTLMGTTSISYNVFTINRATGEITSYPYFDVYNIPSKATEMATLLQSLDNTVIVVIFTYDEPKQNVNAALIYQMKRCGASSTYPTLLVRRSAYILVGIPDMEVNNGLQMYKGTGTNDPNAWIDLRFSVIGGDYAYISG